MKTAEVASTRALPPTVEELRNATYFWLGERMGPVTLANGRWTGMPPAVGAASRPSVELADDFRVVGDLDGDGLEWAVVVLTYSSGGTGVTMGYDRWMADHFFLMVPAQKYVGKFLATFKEFPPSQKVGSFGIDQALEKLTQGSGDK